MGRLTRFLRGLVGGLDNQHQYNRTLRVASMYGSQVGARPNRSTHSDITENERPDEPNAGLQAADLSTRARRAAMEREQQRLKAALHRRPGRDRKA